jgi:hypothetical protein
MLWSVTKGWAIGLCGLQRGALTSLVPPNDAEAIKVAGPKRHVSPKAPLNATFIASCRPWRWICCPRGLREMTVLRTFGGAGVSFARRSRWSSPRPVLGQIRRNHLGMHEALFAGIAITDLIGSVPYKPEKSTDQVGTLT